jgi:signal transduction histidine kinase
MMRPTDALYAMDRATRAIAGELDVERVLQLIADTARELVGSRYAALGTFHADGRIEQFITSGISDEARQKIGPLPRGHGLLGTIIRDGVTMRLPNIALHPDSYGFPPNHPPMRSLLGVPIRTGGVIVGNFYLTEKQAAAEFSPEDEELVEMFALHAGIAIQNARLHQEVRKLAVVDERLRISRDLHDGIIQSIYAVSLSLEDAVDMFKEDSEQAAARVDRAIDRLHTTISDIRTFIVGLGPEAETGFVGAIEAMTRELLAGSTIALQLDLSGVEAIDGRLTPEAAHEVMQIAREAVSNVVRHSGATRATVSVVADADSATLAISDDGVGFDAGQRLGSGHFGLANVRDRTAAVGGSLEIESQPGGGTRLVVRVPLVSEDRRGSQ